MSRWVNARVALTATALLVVTAAHWLTPSEAHSHLFHAIHVLLQKLYALPIVLAAVWFGLSGSCLVAALTTVLYTPYIVQMWPAHSDARIDQFGELAMVWILAILAGILASLQRRALEHAAQMHEGALTALVNALDARERNTRLHSQRVRAFAVRLAEEIGIRARDVAVLSEAALLHDVGKVGVPDPILLKPGKLSADEWKVMQQHSEIGFRILSSVPLLKEAAQIVRAHHERYNGQGYPDGLSGSSIPLGARIFAVVDVFDALTSDRPYHKAMSLNDAANEITQKSGSDFDPAVVSAFKAVPLSEWRHMAGSINAAGSDR